MNARWRQLSGFCSAALVLSRAAVGPSARAADGIQFSRPDVEFAAPQARIPNLPQQDRSGLKSLDFGEPQPRIYVPPPIRVDPRKIERKTVFDEPKLFSDQSEKQDREGDQREQNDTRNDQRSPREKSAALSARPAWLNDNRTHSEEKRALSPVEDFSWTPESDQEKKEKDTVTFGAAAGFGATTRKSDDRWVISALPPGSEPVRGQGFGISFFGVMEQKDDAELTRERMERRLEFEKLLGGPSSLFPQNPLSLGASLAPITSPFAKPEDVAPAPAAPVKMEPVRPLAPGQGFADQPRNWRAPALVEDGPRRFSPASASRSASALEVSRQARPLMGQPTVLDFPSRKF